MFIVHHLGLTAETASLIPVISDGEKQGEGSDKPGRRKDPPWPTIRIIEKLEASPQCSTHLCVRVAPSFSCLGLLKRTHLWSLWGFLLSKALSQLIVSLLLVELFMYYQKYKLKIQ